MQQEQCLTRARLGRADEPGRENPGCASDEGGTAVPGRLSHRDNRDGLVPSSTLNHAGRLSSARDLRGAHSGADRQARQRQPQPSSQLADLRAHAGDVSRKDTPQQAVVAA